jgi:serine/threonine-protein kinase
VAEAKRSDSTAAESGRGSLLGHVLDGRYRIDEHLGAGGVGAVYRGTQVALDRKVAIKILLEGVHPSFTQRFEREAKALAALRHPNIVAVTDYGVSEDTPFLVMELLEGETLAYRLMQGRMQPSAVLDLARQLLRALAFVHEQGLVHRDLKPGNVFIEKLPGGDERLKLLDFGLAKFVPKGGASPDEPPVTRAGDIVGTPAYIAPEQVAGDAIDPRTDTYAVGVMLFQMLCGRVPFEGEPVEQLKSHLVAPVPALRDKRPELAPCAELESLLQRAMAKPRDARFQNATDMLAALEAIPTPWLSEVPTVPSADALASTVLSNRPPLTEPPTQLRSAEATDTQVIRHVRAYSTFALAVISSLAIALAAYLLARRNAGAGSPEAGGKAAPVASAAPAAKPAAKPAKAAPALAPSRNDAVTVSAAPVAPAPEATNADAQAAEAPAPPEPAATPATTAPSAAPQSARPPARNPWARGTPKELRSLRKAIGAGEVGNDRTISVLRRYNQRANLPDDPLGHLLLAKLYMNRGWRSDVVKQYAAVYQLDPSARGAPDMLRDLLAVVAYGSAGSNEAGRLVRDAYGREALPAIDRAMNALRGDEPALARMATLRAAITGQ